MHCVKKCPNTDFFFGPFFPEFGQNTRTYGPEKTPQLDTFHVLLTLGDVNAKKMAKINVLRKFKSF